MGNYIPWFLITHNVVFMHKKPSFPIVSNTIQSFRTGYVSTRFSDRTRIMNISNTVVGKRINLFYRTRIQMKLNNFASNQKSTSYRTVCLQKHLLLSFTVKPKLYTVAPVGNNSLRHKL